MPDRKPRCRDCRRPLVARGEIVVPKGHTKHHGRGLCNVCYAYHGVKGSLQQFPRVGYLLGVQKSAEKCRQGLITCSFCLEVEALAEAGISPHHWAAKLKTSNSAMARRLQRHRKPYLASRVERLAREERKVAAA